MIIGGVGPGTGELNRPFASFGGVKLERVRIVDLWLFLVKREIAAK